MGEVLDARYAHPDHGVGEEGVVGGHDEVTDPGQHQAAGDAGAVHHRDRRLRYLAPAPAHAEVYLHLPGVPGVRAGLVGVIPPDNGLAVILDVDVAFRRADVVTRAEMIACAG